MSQVGKVERDELLKKGETYRCVLRSYFCLDTHFLLNSRVPHSIEFSPTFPSRLFAFRTSGFCSGRRFGGLRVRRTVLRH